MTREWLTLLGSEIKAARQQKRLTTANLAEKIGVTRQTITALEKGLPTVAIGTAFEAAAVLGIQLMGRDQDFVRDRLAVNRAMIELLPRGQTHQTGETNEDQVPDWF
jgi:DNA-binding XRE family transcriptional regulator